MNMNSEIVEMLEEDKKENTVYGIPVYVDDTFNAVERVIKWNMERYDKIYNEELSERLLFEEALEGIEATSEIDMVDSAGDMLFVAVGVLWKKGLLDKIETIHVLNWAIREQSLQLVRSLLQREMFRNYVPGIETAVIMMGLAFKINRKLLHTFGHNSEDVLNIICQSNETKSIPSQKVDPKIKANQDKGSKFVSPKKDIENLFNTF